MNDLAHWLGAQLDEDERIAREALRYVDACWRWDGEENVTLASGMTATGEQMVAITADRWRRPMVEGPAVTVHVAEWDPARVLREVEAKRGIVRAYEAAVAAFDDSGPAMANYDRLVGSVSSLRGSLERLAEVYADRPGFQEAWRP